MDDANTTPKPAAPVDDNQIIAERRAKLAALRANGNNAFPNDFRRDALADDLHVRRRPTRSSSPRPLASPSPAG